MQRSLSDSLSSTGADLQSARAEVARLTASVSALEKELGSSKEDAKHSSAAVDALKKQVRACVGVGVESSCRCTGTSLCSNWSRAYSYFHRVWAGTVHAGSQVTQLQREGQEAAREAAAKLAVSPCACSRRLVGILL